MGIFVGILLLSLLMFIHELGHYITGRVLGFRILEFSLFMGPVLFSYTSKKTDIKYSLKMFPIGASVRFLGEEGMGEEESNQEGAFPLKEKWKRAVVISTGPIVNIVSGILAFLILFGSIGFVTTTISGIGEDSQAATAGVEPSDQIVSINNAKINTSIDYALEMSFIPEDRNINLTVLKSDGTTRKDYVLVPEKMSAYRLGITSLIDPVQDGWMVSEVDPDSNNGNPIIKIDDLILTVNGVSTKEMEEVTNVIRNSGGAPLEVLVVRENEEMLLSVIPTLMQYYTPVGIDFEYESGYIAAARESLVYSVSIIRLTFKSIAKIFTGEIAAKDSLSGPVGVVNMVGNVVSQSAPIQEKVANLLWMFGLISLNLGIFNLLPIPALDGSHLLLIGVEAIRGKKLSPKLENKIVIVGFMMIIGLAILGLIFDIMRIAGV